MLTLPLTMPPALRNAANAWTDAHNLLKRTATFVNHEAPAISLRLKETARLMGSAWAVMLIGGVMAGFSVVHALSIYVPGIPLWAWFGMVGGVLLVIGAVLAARGRRKLESLEPLRVQLEAVSGDAVEVADRFGEAIDETSDAIRAKVESVKSTVASVKNVADMNYQIQQRPWTMLIGAAGLGFAGGLMLEARDGEARSEVTSSAESDSGAKRIHAHREPGILAKLTDVITPQADVVRQIAIGALFSLARDFAHDRVSPPMVQHLDQFFNDATKKFGGRPMSPGALKAYAQSKRPSDTPAAS